MSIDSSIQFAKNSGRCMLCKRPEVHLSTGTPEDSDFKVACILVSSQEIRLCYTCLIGFLHEIEELLHEDF